MISFPVKTKHITGWLLYNKFRTRTISLFCDASVPPAFSPLFLVLLFLRSETRVCLLQLDTLSTHTVPAITTYLWARRARQARQ